MPGSGIDAWRQPVPAVAAHRGGAQEGPENTLYGMFLGLAAGATHLEIDIRGTADDIPMIIHDETVARTTGADGEVADMTAREIRGLDPCHLWSDLAGIATGEKDPPSGFTRRWFRVPTLDDVLATFPGVPLILDLKKTAPASSIANVLGTWNRADDVLLAGYDDDILKDAVSRLEDVPRAAGYQGTMDFFEGRDVDASAIVVPKTHEGIELVDAEYVQQAHDEGMAFWVWTINEIGHAKELMGMGVDGIITDVPSKLSRLRLARLRGELD